MISQDAATSTSSTLPAVGEPARSRGAVDRLHALYVEFSLRAGSSMLVAYAAIGGLIGVEIFAFLAVWPLGIALLLVVLVTGKVAWRRTRQP